jgi:release factor glutamine methyltransferase
MNIKEYLHYAAGILKECKIEAPVLEAGVMLCHVLKCNRTYLYSHYDRVLSNSDLEALNCIINQRKDNVPLQYLIGETEFMSLDFFVSPAVLIPRQDTEILVEKCIELVNEISMSGREKEPAGSINGYAAVIRAEKGGVSILDMCTGSGCIAISIARYCLDSTVTACDISPDALSIAKANCGRNGVQNRVTLRCGNLFEALESEQQFNLIVSNPPYIETKTVDVLQKEVRDYEPHLALDGGQDGLDFYRRIISMSPKYLTNGGYLALEIGYNQGRTVSSLMQKSFQGIEIHKDIGGNDRVVIGRFTA